MTKTVRQRTRPSLPFTAATVREVARAMERELPVKGERVIRSWVGRPDGLVDIRLPVANGSRLAPRGVATRLLREVRRQRLRSFVELPLQPQWTGGTSYRVTTKRCSVLGVQCYDLYTNQVVAWFCVCGFK